MTVAIAAFLSLVVLLCLANLELKQTTAARIPFLIVALVAIGGLVAMALGR